MATRSLQQLMQALRDERNGCPWDREQTFATIAPYTIEEAYEVADAITHGDMQALKSELGDLLFQVIFHSQMAEEAGHFRFEDVVEAITEKMTRRHPHVFADEDIVDAETQSQAWEKHKAAERKKSGQAQSQLDGVALGLPALLRAEKLQKRAARVGFDWPDLHGVIDKIDEELTELKHEVDAEPPEQARISEELGDFLFACVNLARKLDVDAETALRETNQKFIRRFHYIEQQLAQAGTTPEQASLLEMERLWNEAKGTGR